MKIGIINLPNTARLIKCSIFTTTVVLIVCCFQLYHHDHLNFQPTKHIQLFKGGKSHKIKGVKKELPHHSNLSYKHSICLGFYGRLGNNMFQYASAFGIAKLKNMSVRISYRDRIARVFTVSAKTVVNKFHCTHAVQRYEHYHSAYDPKLLNFSTATDVMLLEYLQSWKYFINAIKELRQEFTFRSHIAKTAQEIFFSATRRTKYFQKNGTYVGLHVRRGDMLAAQKKKLTNAYSYNVATKQYILRAMNHFLLKFKRVTFVICSDDMKWVKKQFRKYTSLLHLVFIGPRNKPEIDLAILSLCDHTIMTTGTFSWWAAWLAGGTAVYYKHYIKDGSPLRRQFSHDYADYFYPGWIPME